MGNTYRLVVTKVGVYLARVVGTTGTEKVTDKRGSRTFYGFSILVRTTRLLSESATSTGGTSGVVRHLKVVCQVENQLVVRTSTTCKQLIT